MVGEKLGPYQILAPIGEGGVYRARDPGLNREVAITMLPESVLADPIRFDCVVREVRILASLNHSNVARVYGVEGGGLVSEWVAGDDLKCPQPIEGVIEYSRQIAEALETVHEQGIFHGRLRPAEVKLTAPNALKVLGFGLSTAIEELAPALNERETLANLVARTGQAGVTIGTAAYLAPELLSGKPVDKRADIWAFGAIVFEMLTGKPLFEGPTLADIFTAVLGKDVDFAKLPSTTPLAIRTLLARCLERDPRDRLRDIGEARVLLSRPLEQPPPAAPRRTRFRRWIPVVTGFLLAAALAGWALFNSPAERYYDLTYSAFVEKLETREIDSVVISDTGAGAVELRCTLKNGGSARTVLPADYRDALTEMLRARVVTRIRRAAPDPIRPLDSPTIVLALGILVGLLVATLPNSLRYLAKMGNVLEVARKLGLGGSGGGEG
jgi:serine/threonine protein kinase